VGQQADPFAQRGEHLGVGLEVLRPARHDDLRLVLGGLQHGLVDLKELWTEAKRARDGSTTD
jgi:hypothetical protein